MRRESNHFRGDSYDVFATISLPGKAPLKTKTSESCFSPGIFSITDHAKRRRILKRTFSAGGKPPPQKNRCPFPDSHAFGALRFDFVPKRVLARVQRTSCLAGILSSAATERVVSIFQTMQRKNRFVWNSIRICSGCF